jgi:hypothetical protein
MVVVVVVVLMVVVPSTNVIQNPAHRPPPAPCVWDVVPASHVMTSVPAASASK